MSHGDIQRWVTPSGEGSRKGAVRSPGQDLMDALAAHVCGLAALVAVKHCGQAHRLAMLPRIRDINR